MKKATGLFFGTYFVYPGKMSKSSSGKLYGLIGYPVKHSLSPAMHNAAFQACGINAEYRLFEVKPHQLQDFLLNRKEIEGFNITIPHKVKAREILEEKFPFDKNLTLIEPDRYYVRLSGAVNTVQRRNGKPECYWNTDADGFLKSLDKDLQFVAENKSILLIGCGGAGRAVIAALSWKNVGIKKIYVYDISQEAISSLKKHFLTLPQEWKDIFSQKIEFISSQQIPEKIKDCQLLVNASPVGMKEGDPSVVNKNLLHKDLSVYDLVYNRDTELIQNAKELGLPATGGLGMLLYQGVAAWELWMKKVAPVEVMRKALEEEFKKI